MNNQCAVCNAQIKQMCRKNTGICGEICEKKWKTLREENVKAFEEEASRAHEILLVNSTPISV